MQSQTAPSGAAYFQHHDQLGSVTDLTDATGSLQSSWTYTAYGQSTQTNTATSPPANPFTYTGQYTEPTTPAAGYDLRARNYDPTTGRFTTTDPIRLRQAEPYTSSYSYTGGRPTYAVDLSGQSWWDPITSRLEAFSTGLKQGRTPLHLHRRPRRRRIRPQRRRGNLPRQVLPRAPRLPPLPRREHLKRIDGEDGAR
ncbi:RHS repeat-associated core domain-containing protein [Streptomyces sp. 900105755]